MGFLLMASIVAGLGLGLLLLLGHIVFWPPQRRLTRPEAHVAGVASGWLAFLPLSYLLGIPQAAVAYLVMFCVGGSFILAAWRVRRWLRQADDAAYRAGREDPREPLTQDLIDRGGR